MTKKTSTVERRNESAFLATGVSVNSFLSVSLARGRTCRGSRALGRRSVGGRRLLCAVGFLVGGIALLLENATENEKDQ